MDDVQWLAREIHAINKTVDRLEAQNQMLRAALTTQLRWSNELYSLGGATPERIEQIKLALKDIEAPNGGN